MRRFSLILLIICLFLTTGITSEAAAPAGYWKLTGIEVHSKEIIKEKINGAENFYPRYDVSEASIRYARNGGIQGSTVAVYYEKSFTLDLPALPERISPGEKMDLDFTYNGAITFTGVMDEISGHDPQKPSTFAPDLTVYVSCGIAEDDTSGSHEIGGYPSGRIEDDISVSDSCAFSFTAKQYREYDEEKEFSVSLGIKGDAEAWIRGTYVWSGGEPLVTTEKEEAGDLTLGISVRADERTPLRWVPVTAYVYYGSDKEHSETVSGITDIGGACELTIPRRDAGEGVRVLLRSSLRCIYPYGDDTVLFHLVDTKDSVSVRNNDISFASFISIEPETDWLYCPLSLYQLYLGGSLYRENEPEKLYYSDDSTSAESLYNAGILYGWAWDAWFFGASVFGEQDILKQSDIGIELNWTQSAEEREQYGYELTCSNYNSATNIIRLAEEDTRRDDDSRFTLLHEFGHAFDYLTNGGTSHAPSYEENHGGYLNQTTADSYMEGFATFYAGMVQKYSAYPNPGQLAWIQLGNPSAYVAYETNGAYEELAIASFLAEADTGLGRAGALPTDTWDALKPERGNFSGYYEAIMEKYAELGIDTGSIRQYAYDAGLYTMPFGDGKYNEGEPFRDENGNNAWDEGEPFGDLMFEADEYNRIWDDNGEIIKKPIREYDPSELTVGTPSPANMIRKIIKRPENGYMDVEGEVPDYLLVRVYAEEGGYASMERVCNGRVFIGPLAGVRGGRIEILVPGGDTVYTGDVSDLQTRFTGTLGTDKALDTIEVKKSQLAPEGTVACSVYGDLAANGVVKDEVSAGKRPADRPDSPVISGNGKKKNTSGKLLIAAAVLILAAAAAVLLGKRKKTTDSAGNTASENGMPPQPPAGSMRRYCRYCGTPLSAGAKFCRNCGKNVSK